MPVKAANSYLKVTWGVLNDELLEPIMHEIASLFNVFGESYQLLPSTQTYQLMIF